jgi:hypothetical protein
VNRRKTNEEKPSVPVDNMELTIISKRRTLRSWPSPSLLSEDAE